MIYLKHKNSGKLLTPDQPIWHKHDGVYGYLVFMNNRVWFIFPNGEEIYTNDLTDEFEIIN